MATAWAKKNPQSSFPAPKFMKVFDTEKAKNAILFFDYWERLGKLPDDGISAVRVKVYRTWPQTDCKIAEPDRKDVTHDYLDGKIPFRPAEYIPWFLEKYYSGSWNCQMYERNGESEQLVMQCYFDAIDLEKYPPRVDLRTVLWGKRANQSYEQFLRARGTPIPGDAEFQEQQDMTTGAAIMTEAMKQNAEMVKENKELTKELIESKIASRPTGSGDLALEGLRAYTEMITEGAKAAIEVGKSHDLAASKAYDPFDMLVKAKELLTGNGTGEVMHLVLDSQRQQLSQVVAMHDKTLEYMKERDRNQAQVQTSAASPFDALLMESEKLERVGKLFGWSRRGDPDPPKESSGWIGKVVEKIVENPTSVAAIAGMVTAIAGAFTRGAVQTPAAPVTTPAETVKEPEKPREPTQDEINHAFMEFIEAEFLRHFFDESGRMNGTTFAHSLQSIVPGPNSTIQWAPGGPPTPTGMQHWGFLRQHGIQHFDKMLKSYSPIWSQVQGYAIQPANSKEKPKYFRFLEEFMNADPRSNAVRA